MSRPLRIQYPDAWYHVMNRGRRGEPIFVVRKDYLAFIGLLKETGEMFNVRVGAYCLLPNHYHMLIQTPDANLSRFMRHMNGVYTQRFNRFHQFDGQLFRGRYKSILVDEDTYLLELIRYIHRNPLEAGLVERMDEYPWSTHKGYVSAAKQWNWLHKDFILSFFSSDRSQRRNRYKEFVSMETPEAINRIFGRKKLPAMLGSEGFIARVRREFSHKKRHREVPESRLLTPDSETIKEAVCNAYGVDKSALSLSRRGIANEPRNLAISLQRQLRGDSLEEIGKEFKMNSYSTVSSVIERTKNQILNDRKLRKRFEQLKKGLQMSQEKI
jgi:putative transposase